ncbi:glycerol kinase [Natrialba magadii ATCC 43099]|uniref:Glycerol kinase n=1 Tax=Natrialba magadii (strain ATCC 43099 / DSM 3394 / CCM 3739 / CIP 104546 / IAM 13178 / JCM 8861 / NBRC 102185 / NCIMB 2190 / MS3) TaxID=547559 RepID=D3SQN0_NATMM|nr:glycerol kinase GlpK [Natrialba magadii]ADD04518.1 glycerol kinase [Natrialba magadii ATCC 43099]ELY25175.1 glycerol kinase [Natrialba magadii ATCC 43099]
MTDTTYVGAVDQGTTGTRFIVFNHDGQVVANAYETHEQFYPEPGWVEHDPMEIWENTKTVIMQALGQAGISPEQLEAIGVTNQRETTLLWNADSGNPVHNAIVWQDRRTTERVEELETNGTVETIREKTGLEPDAYFSATKAEWLLDEADPIKMERARPADIRDRAADGDVLFGTIDSWLIYNLTGEHITEVTNASRTMLYNIHDLEWDDDLLEEFSIPEAMLPEVRPSSDDETYGTTDPEGFLEAEVPVAGALGDQQAALFGQTCFDAGDAKNTYGTGSFFLMNTGNEAVKSDHGLLTTIGFQRSGEDVQYALEGSIFVTGAAIEWLEDMSLIDNPSETAELARSVDTTDGVYVVPAFTGLGAPHWDQRARGTIVGMTRGTRKGHVVRATLESIAYQTRDVAEAMEADSGIAMTTLKVDGGAVKNNFLCQLQSDIIGSKIVRPVVDETTALGSAYAAGLAVGYWDDVDSLRDNWQVDWTFDSRMDDAVADAQYDRWLDAVDRSLDWARDGSDTEAGSDASDSGGGV